MTLFRAVLISFVLASVSACASSHRGPPPGGDRHQAVGPEEERPDRKANAALQQPGRLLAKARDTQAKKGCAKAIPSYRIVASFGDGYDIAQYELGACLLKVESSSTNEASLFHEEAVFWLRRAAWAGNARAQLTLAELLSGEKTFFSGEKTFSSLTPRNPSQAKGWAIIYNDNPARGLYGLPEISSFVNAHLQATLTASDIKNAETFANNFEVIKMASFTPPRMQGKKERRQQGPQGQGRPDGQRRRR